MEFTQLTGLQHDVHVHDIAFDFYGKRFATCGTDSKIKIWDFDDESNTWSGAEIADRHNGSIWRLSWAHPEFGNLIASCSEDRTVNIWEEQIGVTRSQHESRDRWNCKATLNESKKSVNDVKFAPRNLGLKLATASGDGAVRIYESSDVFSLKFWQMQHIFYAEDTTQQESAIADTGASSGFSRQSEHGLTCLAWNDCVFEPPKIAVGGYSKHVTIWTFDSSDGSSGKWRQECDLGADSLGTGTLGGVVHDVAWAPAMGRSYHLIAVASRESNFKIYKLNRKADGSLQLVDVHMEAVPSPVWRVAWNATGTVLSTSSEDGTLSLWRKDFSGTWRAVQELPLKNESKAMFIYYECRMIAHGEAAKCSSKSSTWKQYTFDDIDLGEVIGGGGIGVIYNGWFRGTDNAIALKTLFDSRISEDLRQEYLDELLVLSRVKHSNIVTFIGACMTPPNLFFIMELCACSLYDKLHKYKERVDDTDGIRMALDVSSAMEYLHSQRPAVVHRDLKSLNVLQAYDGSLKICDFGLVKVRNSQAGTPAYMAPELLEARPFNKSVDVYSFAVLLWEIFTGEIPWAMLTVEEIRERVSAGTRPRIPVGLIPPQCVRLIEKAWSVDSNQRPEFPDIVDTLIATQDSQLVRLSPRARNSNVEEAKICNYSVDTLDTLIRK